jgi:hypothetical protein
LICEIKNCEKTQNGYNKESPTVRALNRFS